MRDKGEAKAASGGREDEEEARSKGRKGSGNENSINSMEGDEKIVNMQGQTSSVQWCKLPNSSMARPR